MSILVDAFASWTGLPVWFAGGLLGLGVAYIVLAIILRHFKGRGLFLSVLIVGMAGLNWRLFAWPLWAAVVLGIAFLWGTNRG